MKKLCLVSLMMAALSQGAQAADNGYWSNVDASFTHMLNHQPYTGPVAATVALGIKDPVETLVNAIARGETTLAVAGSDNYQANVEMSFNNLLSHEPYAGETATTVARGEKDPMETAVQAVLHNEPQKGISVASEKSNGNALAF